MTSLHSELTSSGQSYRVVDLAGRSGDALVRMPWIHRILLENILRKDGENASVAKAAILDWLATGTSERGDRVLSRAAS